MKILDIVEEANKIRVITDSNGVFVYRADKFNDLSSLKKEIEKKILFRKNDKNKLKVSKLKEDFNIHRDKDELMVKELIEPVEVLKDA